MTFIRSTYAVVALLFGLAVVTSFVGCQYDNNIGNECDPTDSTCEPIAAPIEEEKPDVEGLIAEYCALSEKYPCLGGENNCEAERRLDYYRNTPEECRPEWISALKCASEYDYSCPCEDDNPGDPPCAFVEIYETHEGWDACSAEQAAMSDCWNDFWDNHNFTITGERATCDGQDDTRDNTCHVTCSTVDGRDAWDANFFVGAECAGAPGGPYQCRCILNGRDMGDGSPEDSHQYSAHDCTEATQLVADGSCIRNVDCCFTWIGNVIRDEPDEEHCSCTGDLAGAGFETCEDLATAAAGEVVDLCPRYSSYYPIQGWPDLTPQE